MPNKLQLTVKQKWAVGRELCYLRQRLPTMSGLRDLPSIAARKKRLTQILKLVAKLAKFGAQKNSLDRTALRDLRFAAGIFSKPTANMHSEKDDSSFVERWFLQAHAVKAVLGATLSNPVDPTVGVEIPPFQRTLVANVLPSVFERVFSRELPITRKGVGIQFIRCCLEVLHQPVPPEETIITWLSDARSVKTRKLMTPRSH